MSLVNCPECGRENVSDTAISCPQCGFNLKEYFKNTLSVNKGTYKVVFNGFTSSNAYRKNHMRVDIRADAISLLSDDELFLKPKISASSTSVIVDSITKDTADKIAQYFKELDCIISVEPSDNQLNVEQEEKVTAFLERMSHKVKCPLCNSTNIQKISLVKRGVHGAAFGLLSKTARSQWECLSCGNKW